MRGFYPYVILVSWALWALYWVVSAAHVKRALRLEPLSSRAVHFVPMVVCFGLLAAPERPSSQILFMRFIPASALLDDSGSILVVAGLLFAAWARVHLGSNWSGRVALKHNHELVRTGPYALVRHPIYTGLLLAVLGTALVLGEWRGLFGLAVLCVSYWRKLRLEEALMRETFGDDYRRYCEHTAALIPGVL